MTTKITNTHVEVAYLLGKKVYEQKITISEAADKLSEEYSMNRGSAQGYIYTFLRMMSGEEYRRTINVFATEYFLNGIYADYGNKQVLSALSSVRKHLEYYEGVGKSRQQQIHQVVDDFFKRLSSTTNLADHISEFNKQIDLSGQDDYEDRKSRLNAADKLPVKISVTTEIYRRNPDVVVEVLLRAKGICERCKENAPFIRAKDGTPYLEVHHIVQLALGGEDTVENAIALCPNCHREAHFG